MSFLSQPLSFFSIGPNRSFGGFSGYVTISEDSVDELEITQQPVQQGASIADHAFKKPVALSIQILFNASLFTSLSDIYASLIGLQATLTPFNCVTPKRTYYNMMFKMLKCNTNKQTEDVLSISATFQEVIIVQVATTLVPKSQLKNPASNNGTQTVGAKSALLSLAQGVGLSP